MFTSESKLYVCRGRCPHRPLRVSENRTPCEFHTSNIQRAQTKRLVRRVVRSGNPILRPPEGRSDDGNKTITRTTKRKALQARQRHLRPQRLFSPHSFLARQKRMGRRRHNAPFRRRKDMARGAAVTALIIAPRLRCIRNAPPEAFRTNWCRKECAAFLCKKRNNPTPSRIEICRRGFLWMRPWSGRR